MLSSVRPEERPHHQLLDHHQQQQQQQQQFHGHLQQQGQQAREPGLLPSLENLLGDCNTGKGQDAWDVLFQQDPWDGSPSAAHNVHNTPLQYKKGNQLQHILHGSPLASRSSSLGSDASANQGFHSCHPLPPDGSNNMIPSGQPGICSCCIVQGSSQLPALCKPPCTPAAAPAPAPAPAAGGVPAGYTGVTHPDGRWLHPRAPQYHVLPPLPAAAAAYDDSTPWVSSAAAAAAAADGQPMMMSSSWPSPAPATIEPAASLNFAGIAAATTTATTWSDQPSPMTAAGSTAVQGHTIPALHGRCEMVQPNSLATPGGLFEPTAEATAAADVASSTAAAAAAAKARHGQPRKAATKQHRAETAAAAVGKTQGGVQKPTGRKRMETRYSTRHRDEVDDVQSQMDVLRSGNVKMVDQLASLTNKYQQAVAENAALLRENIAIRRESAELQQQLQTVLWQQQQQQQAHCFCAACNANSCSSFRNVSLHPGVPMYDC